MTREIEISFMVEEPKEHALRKLHGFVNKGTQRITDIYLRHPQLKQFEPKHGYDISESFRLRKKNGKAFVTWKRNHMDGKTWQYADEEETEVASFDDMFKLLTSLGFEELVRVENERHVFTNDAYEIVLDDVEGLGLLLEVESKDPGERKSTDVMDEIRAFVNSTGLLVGDELHFGKPELLLKKRFE